MKDNKEETEPPTKAKGVQVVISPKTAAWWCKVLGISTKTLEDTKANVDLHVKDETSNRDSQATNENSAFTTASPALGLDGPDTQADRDNSMQEGWEEQVDWEKVFAQVDWKEKLEQTDWKEVTKAINEVDWRQVGQSFSDAFQEPKKDPDDDLKDGKAKTGNDDFGKGNTA